MDTIKTFSFYGIAFIGLTALFTMPFDLVMRLVDFIVFR